MDPKRDRSAAEIFADALELPIEKRGRYLDEVCGDDSGVRQEVESLLLIHPRARDFFRQLFAAAIDAGSTNVRTKGEP